MTTIINTSVTVVQSTWTSFKKHVRTWTNKQVHNAIVWTLTRPQVQSALIDTFEPGANASGKGHTAQRALETWITDIVEEEVSERVPGRTEADDVYGLDDYIKSALEDFMYGYEINADSIKGLDSAIEETVTGPYMDELTDEVTKAVLKELGADKELVDALTKAVLKELAERFAG